MGLYTLRTRARDGVEDARRTVQAAVHQLVGGVADLGPCDTREALYNAAHAFDLIAGEGYEKKGSFSDIERICDHWAPPASDQDYKREVYTIALDHLFASEGFTNSRQALRISELYRTVRL